jgi:hypothetical protein
MGRPLPTKSSGWCRFGHDRSRSGFAGRSRKWLHYTTGVERCSFTCQHLAESATRKIGLGVTVTRATLLDGGVAGWVACHVKGSFPLCVAQVRGAVALVGTDNGRGALPRQLLLQWQR